jgi:uncharacterized protein (TIGR02231 family)
MRMVGAALPWFACLAGLASAAVEQPLDDLVTSVTVYSDRARVQRTAEKRLDRGRHRVSFGVLPDAVDPNSVRVRVEGAELLSLEVVRGYGEEELPPHLADKVERLAAIDRELAILQGRTAVLAEEVGFLRRTAPSAPRQLEDGRLPALDTTAQARVISWAAARLALVGDAQIEVDLERATLLDERAILQAELAGTRGGGQATARSRAVATLRADQASGAKLTLEYQTFDARWVPTYDVRLDTKKGEVELGVAALVWQQTDEDWGEVELRLSTAIPSQSADLPQLLSYFLEEAKPEPPPAPWLPLRRWMTSSWSPRRRRAAARRLPRTSASRPVPRCRHRHRPPSR